MAILFNVLFKVLIKRNLDTHRISPFSVFVIFLIFPRGIMIRTFSQEACDPTIFKSSLFYPFVEITDLCSLLAKNRGYPEKQ